MNSSLQASRIIGIDGYYQEVYVSGVTGPTGATLPIGPTGPAGVGVDSANAIATASAMLTGPWSDLSPPTTTSGTPFYVPLAGYYQLTVSATAKSTLTIGIMNIMVYIDGVDTSHTIQCPAIGGVENLEQRQTFPSAYGSVFLTEGTHYIYYRRTGASTTSDSSDVGSMLAVKKLLWT